MPTPAFRGSLRGTIAQVTKALREMKPAAQVAANIVAAPLLLVAFLLTGETHPDRPVGCRHLLEKYL